MTGGTGGGTGGDTGGVMSRDIDVGGDPTVAADALAPDAPLAAVEAWRARGAAQSHPVAFRIVDGLARRAEAQQGEARRLMLRRVAQLMGAPGVVDRPALPATTAADRPEARRVGLDRLAALVDRLGRTPLHPDAPRPNGAPQTGAHAARQPAPASRDAVTTFKDTWSRLRADQRLRQAGSQVPAMAGPLNSPHVVHRTLQTLRDLSPAYLEAFMAQVDTLLWLERASGVDSGDLTQRPAATKDHRSRPERRPRARTPPAQPENT